MGTNDKRLLSTKYYEESEKYYRAGFETKNLSSRYKFWNISQMYKTIASTFEKLEKKGVKEYV